MDTSNRIAQTNTLTNFSLESPARVQDNVQHAAPMLAPMSAHRAANFKAGRQATHSTSKASKAETLEILEIEETEETEETCSLSDLYRQIQANMKEDSDAMYSPYGQGGADHGSIQLHLLPTDLVDSPGQLAGTSPAEKHQKPQHRSVASNEKRTWEKLTHPFLIGNVTSAIEDWNKFFLIINRFQNDTADIGDISQGLEKLQVDDRYRLKSATEVLKVSIALKMLSVDKLDHTEDIKLVKKKFLERITIVSKLVTDLKPYVNKPQMLAEDIKVVKQILKGFVIAYTEKLQGAKESARESINGKLAENRQMWAQEISATNNKADKLESLKIPLGLYQDKVKLHEMAISGNETLSKEVMRLDENHYRLNANPDQNKEEILKVLRKMKGTVTTRIAKDLSKEWDAIIDGYELFEGYMLELKYTPPANLAAIALIDENLKNAAKFCRDQWNRMFVVLNAQLIQFHSNGGYSYSAPITCVEQFSDGISKATNTDVDRTEMDAPWKVHFLNEYRYISQTESVVGEGVSTILLDYTCHISREELKLEERSQELLTQLAKKMQPIADAYGQLKASLEHHAATRALSNDDKEAYRKLSYELEYRQFLAAVISNIGEKYAERFVPTLAELQKMEKQKLERIEKQNKKIRTPAFSIVNTTLPDDREHIPEPASKNKKKKAKKHKAPRSAVTNDTESSATGQVSSDSEHDRNSVEDLTPEAEQISQSQAEIAIEPEPDLEQAAEERQSRAKILGAQRNEIVDEGRRLITSAKDSMKWYVGGITSYGRKKHLNEARTYATMAAEKFDKALDITSYGTDNLDGKLKQLKAGCRELIALCEACETDDLNNGQFVQILREKFHAGQLSVTLPEDDDYVRRCSNGDYFFEVVLRLESSSLKQEGSRKGNYNGKPVELLKCYLHIHVKEGRSGEHMGSLKPEHIVCAHVKRPEERYLGKVERTSVNEVLAMDLAKAASLQLQ